MVFAMNGLTALGFVAVALLTLVQRDGGLRVWLLFGFLASAALEIALPFHAEGHPLLAVAAGSAYYLLTGWQIGAYLHLASLIPERADWLRSRPWVVPFYYVAGLGIGAVGCATYVLQEVFGRTLFPWNLDGWDRVLEQAVLPVWALAVTSVLAAQALRHPEPRGRQQAGLVLAAAIPWMLFTLFSAALERAGFTLPLWADPLETLVLLCYPVAFFAAIFRHHLFDIELVVRRSLLYTSLTGSLMLVFYAALGAGSALFSHFLEGQGSVGSVAGATLLLGLLFTPLRRALDRGIDHRLFPERQALRRKLADLAGELPALGKLPRMGSHLVERLTAVFGIRSAALLIAEPETGLLRALATTRDGMNPAFLMSLDGSVVENLQRSRWIEPEDRVIPLQYQERLTGVLLVGRKVDGGTWPAEELDLLSLLAHHVAIVLENARLFESATYEGLTGLLRREAILEQLGREIERALRYSRPLTVALADLDHFKRINDLHGHLAGDALLRSAAQVIAGRAPRHGRRRPLWWRGVPAGAAGDGPPRRPGRGREGPPPSSGGAGAGGGRPAHPRHGLNRPRRPGRRGRRHLTRFDRRGRPCSLRSQRRGAQPRKHQNAIISPTLPCPWNSPSPES